jgi:hypothetical protein
LNSTKTWGLTRLSIGKRPDIRHLKNENCTISLYKDDIKANLLNFRGGNVEEIASVLGIKPEVEPDGSVGAWITDPDGNMIYFNTMPGEQP